MFFLGFSGGRLEIICQKKKGAGRPRAQQDRSDNGWNGCELLVEARPTTLQRRRETKIDCAFFFQASPGQWRTSTPTPSLEFGRLLSCCRFASKPRGRVEIAICARLNLLMLMPPMRGGRIQDQIMAGFCCLLAATVAVVIMVV